MAEIEPDGEVAPEKSAFDSIGIIHSDLEAGEPLYSAETIEEAIDRKMTIERNGHEFIRVDKLKEVFSK